MEYLVKDSSLNPYILTSLPSVCPHCHKKITPNQLSARMLYPSLEVFFECPDKSDCKEVFIGYYTLNANSKAIFDGITSLGQSSEREFSQPIEELSSQFVKIYNEAFIAEQLNLLEICGVGYRKALEFLIKDYIVTSNPTYKEKVEKMPLGNCIKEYVTDKNTKYVSERAVWLGNDETHYIRKWEGKNLNDLKKLIDLTIHWIEAEILTKSFIDDMP